MNSSYTEKRIAGRAYIRSNEHLYGEYAFLGIGADTLPIKRYRSLRERIMISAYNGRINRIALGIKETGRAVREKVKGYFPRGTSTENISDFIYGDMTFGNQTTTHDKTEKRRPLELTVRELIRMSVISR